MLNDILAALGLEPFVLDWQKVLAAVILLVVCLVAVKLLMKITDRTLKRTELSASLCHFIRTAIKFGLLFLTVLIVASALGVNVTSLVALFSVFGLALSLAVQNSLSNVAGGIQLLSSKPFEAGDYVQAGGIEGTVHDVGIFYTRIHTGDNKLIQVPNSQISAEKIINYTAEPVRRVDLKFSVSYDAAVETVQRILRETAAAHPLTLNEPSAPFGRVANYGESTVEYSLKVWCKTEDYWTVYYDMLEQVKAALDENGVEMTYPHINVHHIN